MAKKTKVMPLSEAMKIGYKNYKKEFKPKPHALFTALDEKACGACALGFALLGQYNGPLAKAVLKLNKQMVKLGIDLDTHIDEDALPAKFYDAVNEFPLEWKEYTSKVVYLFDQTGMSVPKIVKEIRKLEREDAKVNGD